MKRRTASAAPVTLAPRGMRRASARVRSFETSPPPRDDPIWRSVPHELAVSAISYAAPEAPSSDRIAGTGLARAMCSRRQSAACRSSTSVLPERRGFTAALLAEDRARSRIVQVAASAAEPSQADPHRALRWLDCRRRRNWLGRDRVGRQRASDRARQRRLGELPLGRPLLPSTHTVRIREVQSRRPILCVRRHGVVGTHAGEVEAATSAPRLLSAAAHSALLALWHSRPARSGVRLAKRQALSPP
jgi:hypothetical protein